MNTELLSNLYILKTVVRLAMLIHTNVSMILLEKASREETLAPLLNPTMYMEKGEAMHLNVELLRAFHNFRTELEKINDKGITDE